MHVESGDVFRSQGHDGGMSDGDEGRRVEEEDGKTKT